MARPKRAVSKKSTTTKASNTTTTAASTTATTATTTASTEAKATPSSIVPSIPRQLPLRPLRAEQAAKKAAKKAQAADEVIIQYNFKEISHKDILARVRQAYKDSGATDIITSLQAYVKPEESKIYYVINKNITGSIEY